MFGRDKRLRFDSLVRAHARDLFRLAYWLCHDRCLAEDIVQAAFSRVWSNWRQLGGNGNTRAWLFGLVLAEWRALLRRNRGMEVDNRLDERLLELESRRNGMVETRDTLWALTPRQREALSLQVLGQYTPDELGRLLGIDEEDAACALADARMALRRMAAALDEEQHRAA